MDEYVGGPMSHLLLTATCTGHLDEGWADASEGLLEARADTKKVAHKRTPFDRKRNKKISVPTPTLEMLHSMRIGP